VTARQKYRLPLLEIREIARLNISTQILQHPEQQNLLGIAKNGLEIQLQAFEAGSKMKGIEAGR